MTKRLDCVSNMHGFLQVGTVCTYAASPAQISWESSQRNSGNQRVSIHTGAHIYTCQGGRFKPQKPSHGVRVRNQDGKS